MLVVVWVSPNMSSCPCSSATSWDLICLMSVGTIVAVDFLVDFICLVLSSEHNLFGDAGFYSSE